MIDKEKNYILKNWDEERDGTNFIGVLKSIKIENGNRDFVISPADVASVKNLTAEIDGTANDYYRVIMLIPTEIKNLVVTEFEEVVFETRVKEFNIKETPQIKGQISLDAVRALNDIAWNWKGSVRLCFLRTQLKMELENEEDFVEADAEAHGTGLDDS